MATKSLIKKFIQNKGRAEDIDLMDRMLKDGTVPDINFQDGRYGDLTALMYQAEHGTVNAMQWLLNHDPPATVEVKDSSGRTALFGAIDSNHTGKVRLLLDYGADRRAAVLYARSLHKSKQIMSILESYFPENKARQLERQRAFELKKNREQLAKDKICVRIEHEETNYDIYETDRNTDILFKYIDSCQQNREKLNSQAFRNMELEKARLTHQVQKVALSIKPGPSGGKDWSTMSSLSSPPPVFMAKAGGASKKDIPCVFYFRDGPCRFADACPYSHTIRVPV
jgi:hypothetical protein